MNYQQERDEFISIMTQEGVSLETARLFMRHASTLHRLAEAQCNGDWPCDNGERKVVPCTRCESLWVRSSMRHNPTQPAVNGFRPLICQDCRLQDRIREIASPLGIKPDFQGDPRGCVFSLIMPSGRTNMGDRDRGIYVPTRHA